jgi:hypothetical protein
MKSYYQDVLIILQAHAIVAAILKDREVKSSLETEERCR